MKESSFDQVNRQILWELSKQAAAKAKTDLTILIYQDDADAPEAGVSVGTLEAAADQLMLTKNGAIRIRGEWNAGGRSGGIDIVYVKQFSPTAAPVYIVRFLNELVRLRIAKDLDELGSPTLDFVEAGE